MLLKHIKDATLYSSVVRMRTILRTRITYCLKYVNEYMIKSTNVWVTNNKLDEGYLSDSFKRPLHRY